MRELGKDFLLPGAPVQRRNAPMDAAVPKQTVATSQGMYCVMPLSLLYINDKKERPKAPKKRE
jgi:hypothetical protein